METTNTEEEVIIDGETTEGGDVQDTTQELTANLVSLTFTITNTRENLMIVAKDRGYQDVILRPDYAVNMPLEERFIANPIDPIDWLDNHVKDFLAEVASRPFIEAHKLARQAEIDADISSVKAVARQSIS